MFKITCVLLLASVAAQDEPELQHQLAAEEQREQMAEKAATFWQSQTQTQTAELHTALSHEKATALGSASLTACLRTRDVVQMEMAKLQAMEQEQSEKVSTEQRLASQVNETMHSGLSECESKLTITLKNNTASVHKLEDVQGKLQKEHDDLKAAVDAAEAEKEKLENEVAQKQKEFEKEIADAKLAQEAKVANVKKQHAKVMEAHQLLKKAHEALQKQHDMMMKEEEEEHAEMNKQASQQDVLKEKMQECQMNLKNSSDSQMQMRSSEKDAHQAAHSAGAEASNQKWSKIIANMTAENEALEAKVQELKNTAEEHERKAKSVEKDIPEMQTKLRQCRASREKTELDMQKALEHCPKKDVFLQMETMQWP